MIDNRVRQVAYVPDTGHRRLIKMCHKSNDMKTVVLTTEEEGVALLAGAWLGGDRGVLLMQSSGVGNCINMLSLTRICRMPLLILVTMRGEWGEFNIKIRAENLPLVLPPKDGAHLKDRFRLALLGAKHPASGVGQKHLIGGASGIRHQVAGKSINQGRHSTQR